MSEKRELLLCYRKLGLQKLVGGELWVAITEGTPDRGGAGVVIYGGAEAQFDQNKVQLAGPIRPGEGFNFTNTASHASGLYPTDPPREVVALDDAPDPVAAAWMKYHHQGRFKL